MIETPFCNYLGPVLSAINSQHVLPSHQTLKPEIFPVQKWHQQFPTLQSFGKGKINACAIFWVWVASWATPTQRRKSTDQHCSDNSHLDRLSNLRLLAALPQFSLILVHFQCNVTMSKQKGLLIWYCPDRKKKQDMTYWNTVDILKPQQARDIGIKED